jgi:protein-tyrosine-phosphatase/predicted phosphodiesterase
MMSEAHGQLRVLFLCTGNSARSQIAEAVLRARGRARFHVESAGTQPAPRVNPFAITALESFGLEWGGRQPRGIDEVRDEQWDWVITVCDRARETCPTFPERTAVAHWSIPDPAASEGGDEHRLKVFRETVQMLSRRIDLLLALPAGALEAKAREERGADSPTLAAAAAIRTTHTEPRPMKYALISDIHANLPALEAVLKHIAGQEGIVATYHLGDLVGYAPWPNETVALLKGFRIQGIAGNYDSTVATDYKHCGCKYEDPQQEELSHLSYDWTRKNSSLETKRFLAGLPFRMDVRPRGGHTPGPRLILVHGTPTLNTLYWTEDRDDAFCLKMAEHAGAKAGEVICFGHTHKPWHRVVDGIHFVNTGSVGRPKDGDWRAGYVLVDMGADKPEVEFLRVNYDLERARTGILASTLPHEFADYLATGGKPKPAEIASKE